MAAHMLTQCDIGCHRLQLRDQLRRGLDAIPADHPKRIDWEARVLLAESLSCAAFAGCPGPAASQTAEGDDAAAIH